MSNPSKKIKITKKKEKKEIYIIEEKHKYKIYFGDKVPKRDYNVQS